MTPDQFANLKQAIESVANAKPSQRQEALQAATATMTGLALTNDQLGEIMPNPTLRGSFKEVAKKLHLLDIYFPDDALHRKINADAFRVDYVDNGSRLKGLMKEFQEVTSKAGKVCRSVELVGARRDGKSRALLNCHQFGSSVVYINTRARESAGMPSRTLGFADFLENCSETEFLFFLKEILTIEKSFLDDLGNAGKQLSLIAQEFAGYLRLKQDEIVSRLCGMSDLYPDNIAREIDELNRELKLIKMKKAFPYKKSEDLLKNYSVPMTLIVFDHVSKALADNCHVVFNALKLLKDGSQLLAVWVSPNLGRQISPHFYTTVCFTAGFRWKQTQSTVPAPKKPKHRASPRLNRRAFEGDYFCSAGSYALIKSHATPKQVLTLQRNTLLQHRTLESKGGEPQPENSDIHFYNHLFRVSSGDVCRFDRDEKPVAVMLPIRKADKASYFVETHPNEVLVLLSLQLRGLTGDSFSLHQFAKMAKFQSPWRALESVGPLLLCVEAERIMSLGGTLDAVSLDKIPFVSLGDTFQRYRDRLTTCSPVQHGENSKESVDEAFEALERIRHRVFYYGQLFRTVVLEDIEDSANSCHGYRTCKGDEGVDFVLGAVDEADSIVPVFGQIKCVNRGLSPKKAIEAFKKIDKVAERLGKSKFVAVLLDMGAGQNEWMRAWVDSNGVIRLHIRLVNFGDFLSPDDEFLAGLLNNMTTVFTRKEFKNLYD